MLIFANSFPFKTISGFKSLITFIIEFLTIIVILSVRYNIIIYYKRLTVTRREFVSNHRLSECPESHFGEIVSIAISASIILVNICLFICSEHAALVLILNDLCMVVTIFFNGGYFSNNYITIF